MPDGGGMKNALAIATLLALTTGCGLLGLDYKGNPKQPVEPIRVGMLWTEAKEANGGKLSMRWNSYEDGWGVRVAKVGHVWYEFEKDYERFGHHHYECTRISF